MMRKRSSSAMADIIAMKPSPMAVAAMSHGQKTRFGNRDG